MEDKAECSTDSKSFSRQIFFFKHVNKASFYCDLFSTKISLRLFRFVWILHPPFAWVGLKQISKHLYVCSHRLKVCIEDQGWRDCVCTSSLLQVSISFIFFTCFLLVTVICVLHDHAVTRLTCGKIYEFTFKTHLFFWEQISSWSAKSSRLWLIWSFQVKLMEKQISNK